MRYAAVGDSFTEGVGDERPDGSLRGWADLVAAGLAGASGAAICYANLAVRGRLLEPIVTGQLEAALSLAPAPTVLTLNGGGNDMLRPLADNARLVALTERAVRRCAEVGVQLVLLSGPDPSDRLPFGRAMRRRAEALTTGLAELAATHRVTFVDAFHDTEIRRPAYWSPDRLHLNPAGHQRVAALVLAALGEPAAARAASAGSRQARRLLAELGFYREHALPWVGRRLRGRSSGDGRDGKHLGWTSVPPSATPTPAPEPHSAG